MVDYNVNKSELSASVSPKTTNNNTYIEQADNEKELL